MQEMQAGKPLPAMDKVARMVEMSIRIGALVDEEHLAANGLDDVLRIDVEDISSSVRHQARAWRRTPRVQASVFGE